MPSPGRMTGVTVIFGIASLGSIGIWHAQQWMCGGTGRNCFTFDSLISHHAINAHGDHPRRAYNWPAIEMFIRGFVRLYLPREYAGSSWKRPVHPDELLTAPGMPRDSRHMMDKARRTSALVTRLLSRRRVHRPQ